MTQDFVRTEADPEVERHQLFHSHALILLSLPRREPESLTPNSKTPHHSRASLDADQEQLLDDEPRPFDVV